VSLKVGQVDVRAMAKALDPEYANLDPKNPGHDDMRLSIEEFARAALDAAEEIFRRRAQFVVVGQLSGSKERRRIDPSDPEAIKLSLGWYSTEGDARSAAESLYTSTQSGDTFRTWVLNVHHGTPAELHAERKAKYVALEQKQADARRERLKASIEKFALAAEIRAAGGRGSCDTCAHQAYDHGFDGSSRGGCKLTGCSCERWKEKR